MQTSVVSCPQTKATDLIRLDQLQLWDPECLCGDETPEVNVVAPPKNKNQATNGHVPIINSRFCLYVLQMMNATHPMMTSALYEGICDHPRKCGVAVLAAAVHVYC